MTINSSPHKPGQIANSSTPRPKPQQHQRPHPHAPSWEELLGRR